MSDLVATIDARKITASLLMHGQKVFKRDGYLRPVAFVVNREGHGQLFGLRVENNGDGLKECYEELTGLAREHGALLVSIMHDGSRIPVHRHMTGKMEADYDKAQDILSVQTITPWQRLTFMSRYAMREKLPVFEKATEAQEFASGLKEWWK